MSDVAGTDAGSLRARLRELPGAAQLLGLERRDVYLVGGAVRDLLLGASRVDVDLAVEGDPQPVAAELGEVVRAHERFGTVSARIGTDVIDVAHTRTETYPRPGALPDVAWSGLEEDLRRRDFSVNAMAISLGEAPELIDPLDGFPDLRARRLRVLHERSFADDPTRAIRAARYATRLGFELDARTEELVRGTDLGTVSADRIEAELRRLAIDAEASRALALLADWGVVEADLELGARARALAVTEAYAGLADPAAVLLSAAAVRAGAYSAGAELPAARELAAAAVDAPPSALAARGRGRGGVELVIARALGAEWLDDYVSRWRRIRLEIGGADLLNAGIEEGPEVGRGLAAALDAKVDGEVDGRDAELEVALRAVRS